MRIILLLAASVVPVVLASPQAYGYGIEHHGRHHRKHHYRPSGVPFSTGGAFPTGGASASAIGTAPYGLGNSTAGPASSGPATGTQIVGNTVHHTVFTTVSGPSSSAIVSANGQDSKSDILISPSAVGSATVNEAAAGSASACDSGTVTTTFNPTFTVTVTQSQADSVGASIASSASESLSQLEGSSTNFQSPETVSSKLPTVTTQSTSVTIPTSTQSRGIVISSSPTTSQSQSSEASASTSSASESKVIETTASSMTSASTTLSQLSSQVQSSVAIRPTTASSSTASASPVSSSKAAAGGKRGILASGTDQDALVSAFDNSSKITWLCNWYSAPPQNLGSHIEFVPQDYGKESNTPPKYEWTTNAKQAIARGAKHFLGFGEPEAPDTATMHTNMDPATAVDLFMSDLQPYAEQGIKVGAPAVLQPDPDIAWLKQFMTGCDQR